MKKYYSVMLQETMEVCVKAASAEEAEQLAIDGYFKWDSAPRKVVSVEEGLYDETDDAHLINEFKRERRYAEGEE